MYDEKGHPIFISLYNISLKEAKKAARKKKVELKVGLVGKKME